MTADKAVEAIDEAFTEQVKNLFANLCSTRAADERSTIENFDKSFHQMLVLRDHAEAAAKKAFDGTTS